MLTKERKKQLDTDLWIIAGVSLLVLVIYTVFGREIDNIAADTAIPIVLRVLFMGGIFQFGIAWASPSWPLSERNDFRITALPVSICCPPLP